MAYTKNTWANGDVITKAKLDNIEDGIYDNTVTTTDVVGGVANFKNADGTTLFSVNLPSAPTPTNMITNGDFSQAGATTDGWAAYSPTRSTIEISDGKLVLVHTTTSNYLYGVTYNVQTVADHVYYVRYKIKKTEADSDGDAKVLRFILGADHSGQEATRVVNISQNDIIENVFAIKADATSEKLVILFGGNIATAASNNSMLELYYIEMYDVTDIMPN